MTDLDPLEEAYLDEQDPGRFLDRFDDDRERTHKSTRAHDDGHTGIGPSDTGSCRRAVQLRERTPVGLQRVPADKRAAVLGTMLHDGFTAARRAQYPYRRFDLRVTLPGMGGEYGTLDEWDPEIGRVTDYKTASEYEWERATDAGPKRSQWAQVHAYAAAILAEHPDAEVIDVEILLVRRSTGEVRPFVMEYDPEFAEETLTYLRDLVTAVNGPDPLDRVFGMNEEDATGPTLHPICAKHCEFVAYCWRLWDVPRDGESVERRDLLTQHGTDADLVLLRDHAATSDRATAADNRRKHLRTLLRGLPQGTYADGDHDHVVTYDRRGYMKIQRRKRRT